MNKDYESNDYEMTFDDYNDAMEISHYWSILHAYADLVIEHGRKQVNSDLTEILNKVIMRIVNDENGQNN